MFYVDRMRYVVLWWSSAHAAPPTCATCYSATKGAGACLRHERRRYAQREAEAIITGPVCNRQPTCRRHVTHAHTHPHTYTPHTQRHSRPAGCGERLWSRPLVTTDHPRRRCSPYLASCRAGPRCWLRARAHLGGGSARSAPSPSRSWAPPTAAAYVNEQGTRCRGPCKQHSCAQAPAGTFCRSCRSWRALVRAFATDPPSRPALPPSPPRAGGWALGAAGRWVCTRRGRGRARVPAGQCAPGSQPAWRSLAACSRLPPAPATACRAGRLAQL